MLKLKDKNKKLIAGLINYKDLCIESTLSTGDKKLSFSLPKEDKFYDFIEEECYIETKTQEYVIKARDVGIDYTRFECVLNLETLEANIFDRFESVEQTITASLNLAIVGTGWTVKDNTLKKKRTVRCTNKNALGIVQEIKKTYRVDIVFNTLKREIEVYEHLGEDKGTYFIDSLNLTALQVQSDSYKFATRIIAEGKDGLTFADINGGKNYVENYQYSKKVKTLYWKDERYTLKESLLEDAKAKLKEISKPYTSYNASVLNLAELNPKYKNILDYKLGDTITLISRNNKVKDKQRIVKTVEYPNDHSRDTVELANAVLKFEDIQQENQETTATVSNITTDNGTLDGSTIDSITTKQIEDFEANVIKVAKLKAILAEIENLHVNKADIQNLNAVIAKIGTLEVTKASIAELNAIHAIIQQLKVGKADIADLNAAVAKVGILENKTAVLENALAGNLTADNFKTNAITAGSAVIAEGAIGSSQISSLSVNKLEAGDITTSKHRIVSADGTIEIVGNQILINRNNVNRVILGEYRKSDGTTDYGLLVRAKDGQTIMLDGNGVHNAGITDGAIDNNKVADNANISGNKLDINSVIREVNNNGTETIKGTKVTVGDKNLDVELSTQKNTITDHSKELSSQKASLTALDNALKFKVDEQVYRDSINTINNNISTTNSNLSKATTELKLLKGKVDLKVNKIDIDKTVKEIEDKIKVTTDKITTAESKFTQENNSIKASVQDLNSTTQSITTNVSNINRDLTSKINSNLDAAKSFATDIAIAKANLAKEQAIASADGKITAEEQKRIQQAQANLNAAISKATEAETKAKSYADVKKQEAINSANNNTANTINNLDIGIYNLANESGNFLDNTGFFVANGGTLEIDSKNTFRGYNTLKIRGNSGACYKDYIELQGNTIYCYSCWIKSDRIIPINSSTPLHMWIKENIDDGTVHREIILKYSKEINLNWQQVYVIFKTPSEKQKYLMKPFVYGIGEATVWLANFQVKKGNILNDWTPNPNDLKRYSEEVANAKAELAKQQAIANADGKITEEEKKRIQQAQENLNVAIARADKAKQEAINSANSHADSKANEALNNAKAYTNAEITTVNSKVHNVESNLNILKDKIESKVSQSDIDKSIQEIKIGGRNLLLNTEFNNDKSPWKGVDFSSFSSYKDEGYVGCIFANNKVGNIATLTQDFSNSIKSKQAKYSLSFYDFTDEITRYWLGVYYYDSSNQQRYITLRDDNNVPYKTWTFRKYTFELPSNSTNVRVCWWHYGVNNPGDRGGLWLGNIKLEEGEIATAWTPAPEDTNQLVVDNIKIVDSKISDVSSSVTQLRDSVTTQINSINSKTQSIETSLNGKATKQEVIEVNNKVATIKASLDGITQRVSATESKTQTLENNINGKASKQEVNNVSSKVVSLESNLNGITNRVSSTESRINNLDGKLAGAVTKQEFTEFRQNSKEFELEIKNGGTNNLIQNGDFEGDFYSVWERWGNPSEISILGEEGSKYLKLNLNGEGQGVRQVINVEPHTTYTFTCYCENDPGVISIPQVANAGSYPGVEVKGNGVFSFTFTTQKNNIIFLYLGRGSGGTNGVTRIFWATLTKGNLATNSYIPNSNEINGSVIKANKKAITATYSDGSYTKMGYEGFEWWKNGMKHPYHCLMARGSMSNVNSGQTVRIWLPEVFRGKEYEIGWWTGNVFPANPTDCLYAVNSELVGQNKQQGWFDIKMSMMVRNPNNEGSPNWRGKANVVWIAIA